MAIGANERPFFHQDREDAEPDPRDAELAQLRADNARLLADLRKAHAEMADGSRAIERLTRERDEARAERDAAARKCSRLWNTKALVSDAQSLIASVRIARAELDAALSTLDKKGTAAACHHTRTARGKDAPRAYGSWRTEVCQDCGAFRTYTHNPPDAHVSAWRPADEYADATAEREEF